MKWWALYATSALSGLATTMLGPLLGTFMARLGLGDGAAGAMFTAQFGAAVVGSLTCGWVLSRFGYRKVLVAGYVVLACGGAMIGLREPWMVAMAVLMAGYSMGWVIPSSNLLLAKVSGEAKAARLNLLNLCWGLGAVAGPVVISAVNDHWGMGAVAGLMAGMSIASALMLGWTIPDERVAKARGKVSIAEFPWAVAGLLFLYVGAETAVAGWLPTMAARRHGAGPEMASIPLSCFWGAVLIGRAVTAAVLKRYGLGRIMTVSLVASPLSVVALAVSGSLWMTVAAAAFAGLALAPVFPNAVSMIESENEDVARKLGPPVFGAGGLGGSFIPWVAGWMSSGSPDVRVVLAPVMVCLLGMIPVWMRVRGARARETN